MAGSAVVGTLRALLTLDTADYDQALVRVSKASDKWSKDLGAMGRQATEVGKSLTSSITLPLVGIAAMALKTGAEFETAMNQINGVLQPTEAQLESIRKTAMKMGADTVFSATDAAEAMLELGKAGFNTDTAISSVDEVLQLAAASGMSMADSASLAARTLNAFGLEATDLSHVNDVLAKAVNTTSLEIGDMQVAFGYIGPIATGFGLSIEQVSAALGIMRDAGVQAETAGRSMRMGLTRLVNPTKAVKDAMAELGVESFVSNGKLMDLGQIIEILRERGMTTGQAMKLFGQEAGPGMSALVSKGRDALDNLTEGLVNSQGAAKKMADAMMEGLPGAMERLRGSVETAWLSISKAIEPVAIMVMDKLGAIADFITNWVVPAFQALPSPVQMGVFALAALAAAVGPVLWIAGQLITTVATVTTAFGAKGLATRLLTGNVISLSGALRLVGPAVAVAATAFAGWQIGSFIGELEVVKSSISGLVVSMMGWGNTAVPLAEQQRTIAHAIRLGADEGITFAAALEFMKKRAEDLRGSQEKVTRTTDVYTARMVAARAEVAALTSSQRLQIDSALALGESMDVVGRRLGLSADAQRIYASTVKGSTGSTDDLTDATQRKAEADEKAKKAAEDLKTEIERQAASIRALGLVTRKDAVAAMEAFEETLKNATAAGIPVDRTLAALRPRLIELIANARASGIAVDDMVEALVELDQTVVRLRGGIPRLSAAISTTVPQARDLATGIRTVTAEQQRAETQTYLTERAFSFFGATTRSELRSVYDTAKRSYDDMLASGVATADQLAAAWGRVQEAGVAAGVVVVGAWEGTVKPVIMGFIQNISDAFSTSITDMLTGAASFSEGFSGMWSDLKDVTRGAIDSMVSGFINDGLNKMMESLEAWVIKAQVQLASFFSMAALGFAAVAAGFALVKMGWEWGKAFFGPHFGGGNADGTATDPHEYDNYSEFFPPADGSFAPSGGDMPPEVPGFETGTNGRYVDFGAGTMAMLHGKEKITPMGSGEQAVFIFQRDSREEARVMAPFIVGEVQRLQLSR